MNNLPFGILGTLFPQDPDVGFSSVLLMLGMSSPLFGQVACSLVPMTPGTADGREAATLADMTQPEKAVRAGAGTCCVASVLLSRSGGAGRISL